MQKRKENVFHEKFRLLNSQENTADIKWSSSSSSEYENIPCKEKFCNLDKTRNRKRKRKKKVPMNLSNLDITIVDSCIDSKTEIKSEKSPILVSKHRVRVSDSPILMSNRFPPNKDINAKSPILCNKTYCVKSPILKSKSASPKISGSARKMLSYDKTFKEENNSGKENYIDKQITSNNNEQIKSEANSFTESESSLKARLIEKVKSYFDNHFSSENTSQNISDTPTPTDCSKGEDIEILSCKTQTITNIQGIKAESFNNSDTSFYDKITKKVKHKKGGLAYRLNVLLKKQNAHVCLWQHERFLAGNSNFVIPKEENVMFRIKSIDFNYGCYLLNVINMYDKKYFIVINCKYVNTNIIVDSIFKLYDPYKILEFNDEYKIIINVCKFESVVIKD